MCLSRGFSCYFIFGLRWVVTTELVVVRHQLIDFISSFCCYVFDADHEFITFWFLKLFKYPRLYLCCGIFWGSCPIIAFYFYSSQINSFDCGFDECKCSYSCSTSPSDSLNLSCRRWRNSDRYFRKHSLWVTQ